MNIVGNSLKERGIVYLDVTSDGTLGSRWASRLHERRFGTQNRIVNGGRIVNDAQDVLLSPDFKSSLGITTKMAIVCSGLLGKYEDDWTMKRIFSEASKRNFVSPPPETACLLREKLSDKKMVEMGLYCIVVMHDGITAPDGSLKRLELFSGEGGGYLFTTEVNPQTRFRCFSGGVGFAFACS